jgi:exopolysaccharide production protein ExoZ
MHSYQDLRAPTGIEGYGAFGVDLFFVISGFIMANVAQGRAAEDFLSERLWRIYPMWWIAVVPWLFIISLSTSSVLSSLTLWPVYADGYHVPALQVGWTLSFELLFYLGVSAAIATRPIVPIAIYMTCLAGALAVSSPLLDFIGSPMALEFLAGVVIARLPRRKVLGAVAVLGIAILGITSPSVGSAKAALVAQSAIWRPIEWGLPAALILWSFLCLEPLLPSRLLSPLVFVGDASYSIYLFHPFIACGLDLLWPLRFAIAIGLGCSVHLLLERRLLAVRRRASAAPVERDGNRAEGLILPAE